MGGDRPGTDIRGTDRSEVRALWVLRTSLSSPASIPALVQTASDHGFNTLLVQVRGRGDAYYDSDLEPRAAELQRQPATFDPLAPSSPRRTQAGLRVHAWINVNLVSSAVELPLAREHLVYRHPEWLMVPRDIAQERRQDCPRQPRVRREDGAMDPRASRASSKVSTPRRSCPAPRALYRDGRARDRQAIPDRRRPLRLRALSERPLRLQPARDCRVPRRRSGRGLTTGCVARWTLDEKVDLFAYPDALPDDWRAFRDRADDGAHAPPARRREGRAARRPGHGRPPSRMLREAYDDRLQDWGDLAQRRDRRRRCARWRTRRKPAASPIRSRRPRGVASGRPIWAGIGAYRLTPAQTVDNIQAARRLGAAGFILFSYDSLTDPKLAAPATSTSSVAELCRGRPSEHITEAASLRSRPLVFSAAPGCCIGDCRSRAFPAAAIEVGRRNDRDLAGGLRSAHIRRRAPPQPLTKPSSILRR